MENNVEILRGLNLNPRLEKIAKLIPPCRSLADIGTDHAYIPIYAVLCGLADFAVASDVNPGPVKRAEENVKRYGLDKKISLRLGNGLETINPDEAEVIVIAGMGGLLISNILEASREIVNSAKLLILQPMTAQRELREYLVKIGLAPGTEYLVAEEDKIYNIFAVSQNSQTTYTEQELIFGKGLEKTSPEFFEKHQLVLTNKFKKQLSGLVKSQTPENKKRAKDIEKILAEINL